MFSEYKMAYCLLNVQQYYTECLLFLFSKLYIMLNVLCSEMF